MDTPQKLTDAWAEWVIRKLTSNGETALSDADIAAIIVNTASVTRSTLNGLLGSASDSTLTQANEYADRIIESTRAALAATISSGDINAVATAKAYTDNRDAATLSAAKAYTDEHLGTGGVSKSYVDDADSRVASDAASNTASALTSAKTYADGTGAQAFADAKTHVAQQLAAYVSRETVNGLLSDYGSEWLDSARSMDADVLAQAKAYTDDHAGSGGGSGGATEDYVDEQTGLVRSDLTAAIATAQQSAIDTAHSYTDDAIELAASGTAQLIDDKNANTVDYVDTQDAAILAAAKQYTDQAGGGGGTGGASQAYVDNGDVSTLSSARTYADTKASDALNGAKSYADQYARPSGGWTKAQLEASVQTSLSKADTAMQPVDLVGGALTYGSAFTGSNAGFTRNRDKLVKLNGILQGSSSVAVGTKTSGAATLPAGSRPPSIAAFTCPTGAGVANVVVNTDGTIDITNYIGASSYARIDGISFYAS